MKIVFQQQLRREKTIFDEFLGREAPAGLQDEHAAAVQNVEAWYTFSTTKLLPEFLDSLPARATLQQLNVAAAKLDAGYAPYVTKVNQSMADLASGLCTVMRT